MNFCRRLLAPKCKKAAGSLTGDDNFKENRVDHQ
jgi:hypothetical protein